MKQAKLKKSQRKNLMKVKQIIKQDHVISYDYEISGDWEKYFTENNPFFVEYNKNIEYVPNSIAIIPLIGNSLIAAALFQAVIEVEEVDETFYEAIPNILQGYQDMYPDLHFYKENIVCAQSIIKNKKKIKDTHSMLYFSGGVDAYSSLITHENEDLELACIWGADIPLNNEKAFHQVEKENQKVSKKHGLPLTIFRSNLRTFLNEDLLSRWTVKQGYDGWWYNFQHSIGMLTLAAPYSYQKIDCIYFASTYSNKMEKGYALASDPSIDNQIQFANTKIKHDGFEFSRQDKVARLCHYSKKHHKKIYLRVCYRSHTGDNCSVCRKCVMTMMSILVEGFQPEDFGFVYDRKTFPKLFLASMKEVAYDHPYDFLAIFTDIQNRFREQFSLDEIPVEWKVFYLVDVSDLVSFLSADCNYCLEKDKYIKMLEDGKNWLEEHSNEQERYIQNLLIENKRLEELLQNNIVSRIKTKLKRNKKS